MISHDVMHLLDYYYDNDFGQVMCVGPQPIGKYYSRHYRARKEDHLYR